MEIPKKKEKEETEPIFEGLYLGKAYHILVKFGTDGGGLFYNKNCLVS